MIERGSPEWEENVRRYHERIDENIARVGHSMTGVFGSEDSLPFIYTIGLQRAGLPELLFIGGYDQRFGAIMNLLAEKMQAEGVFPDGQPVEIGGKFPLVAVHCDSPNAWDEYAVVACDHFKTRDFRIIQLVAPDPEGRYPWMPGCVDPWARQEILGRTPTWGPTWQ